MNYFSSNNKEGQNLIQCCPSLLFLKESCTVTDWYLVPLTLCLVQGLNRR